MPSPPSLKGYSLPTSSFSYGFAKDRGANRIAPEEG